MMKEQLAILLARLLACFDCFALLCLLFSALVFNLRALVTLNKLELVKIVFGLLGFLAAWLGVSPIGLVWLCKLASWHVINLERKHPLFLLRIASPLANFEVEHDFVKHTHLL